MKYADHNAAEIANWLGYKHLQTADKPNLALSRWLKHETELQEKPVHFPGLITRTKERLALDSHQWIYPSNLEQFNYHDDQPLKQIQKIETWKTSEDLAWRDIQVVDKCRKIITHCYRHEKYYEYNQTRTNDETCGLVAVTMKPVSLIGHMPIKSGARNEHIRSEYTFTNALLKHPMCEILDAFPSSEIRFIYGLDCQVITGITVRWKNAGDRMSEGIGVLQIGT
ncbi:hypothetical protein CLF_108373 [Clonorchis sinensis]|uniref:Uncharacterized protein n=1 Tax=Clonorchis sinensis TaxID=79923 RepID=G7YRK6_CLOSI|nr:hypothetical protein CLF_108373 [Clonorchis sinensis]